MREYPAPLNIPTPTHAPDQRKSGKSRKNADLGSGGSGGHFDCKFFSKITQKLRSASFGTNNFRKICWEPRQFFHSHGFRIVWLPKPITLDLGAPILQQILRAYQLFSGEYYFGKSWNVDNRKLWKSGGRQIPKARLVFVWTSWIWDQYLRKNMKWNFDNMGSIFPKQQ